MFQETPLIPGMYGAARPNIPLLTRDWMSDQVQTRAHSVVPTVAVLKEWCRGTLGIDDVGGENNLGGWWPTRSVVVVWTDTDHGNRRAMYYMAGDSNRYHFFADDPTAVTFNKGLFLRTCRAAVRVLVATALDHAPACVHGSGVVALRGWVQSVIEKEVAHACPLAKGRVAASGLSLRTHLLAWMHQRIRLEIDSRSRLLRAAPLPPNNDRNGIVRRRPAAWVAEDEADTAGSRNVQRRPAAAI